MTRHERIQAIDDFIRAFSSSGEKFRSIQIQWFKAILNPHLARALWKGWEWMTEASAYYQRTGSLTENHLQEMGKILDEIDKLSN